MPDGCDCLIQISTAEIEDQQRFARLAFFHYRRLQRSEQARIVAVAEIDALALFDAFCRSQEGFPAVRPGTHMQCRADLGPHTLPLAKAFKLCRYHFGIIEYQCISRAQKIAKIPDGTVLESGYTRLHKQKPR